MTEPKDAHAILERMLVLTREQELDCGAFQEHLAAMLEGTLDSSLHALMDHHREICPECEEERAILARALGLDPPAEATVDPLNPR